MERILASLTVLLFHLLISYGRGENEACPLRCMNGSTCKAGNATFANHPNDTDLPFHQASNGHYYHCACEEGFTGLTCSIVYESCADSSSFHTCYHGGSCVVGDVDDFGNQQYTCDCSTGTRGDRYFTGKYCQEEHIQTCDYSQGIFCNNGGVCKDEPNGESYCQCEDGFLGSLCDKTSVVDCGDIMCYNGAPCMEEGGKLYCDCSQTVIAGKRFRGQSCDEETNVFCDESKQHFCLNHGDCVDEGNG